MEFQKKVVVLTAAIALSGCASLLQEDIARYKYNHNKVKNLFQSESPYYVPTTQQIASHVSRNGVRDVRTNTYDDTRDTELQALRRQIEMLTKTVSLLMKETKTNLEEAKVFAASTSVRSEGRMVKVSSIPKAKIKKVRSTQYSSTKAPVLIKPKSEPFRIKPMKSASEAKSIVSVNKAVSTPVIAKQASAKTKLSQSKRTYRSSSVISSIPVIQNQGLVKVSSSSKRILLTPKTKSVSSRSKETRGIVKGEPIDVVVRFKHQKMRNYFVGMFKQAGYKDLFSAHSKKSNDWLIYLGRYNAFDDAYERYKAAGTIATRGSVEMIHRKQSYSI